MIRAARMSSAVLIVIDVVKRDHSGESDLGIAQTTHPDEAPPRLPFSPTASHRGAKKVFNPLCGLPERGWSSEA
ncbi:hypothetical protein FHS10_003739 [Mucilaginibacter dorajii]|nr:hypothetical protein [Mucilaginibacter dorajii]